MQGESGREANCRVVSLLVGCRLRGHSACSLERSRSCAQSRKGAWLLEGVGPSRELKWSFSAEESDLSQAGLKDGAVQGLQDSAPHNAFGCFFGEFCSLAVRYGSPLKMPRGRAWIALLDCGYHCPGVGEGIDLRALSPGC